MWWRLCSGVAGLESRSWAEEDTTDPLAKLCSCTGCAVRELNVLFPWGRTGWGLFLKDEQKSFMPGRERNELESFG